MKARWITWKASSGGSLRSVQLSSALPRESHGPPPYAPPLIEKAREFRDLLLPRRIVDEAQPTKHRLASPGELQDENGGTAELYDFIKTPAVALDEFGVGVSLYFASVKALFVVFVISSLILLLSLSENRSHQHVDNDRDPPNGPYCNHTDSTVPTRANLLGSVYGARSEDLKLNRQGAADIVISIFLAFFAVIFHYAQEREIERIDVAQQTTQDYSVVVTNPPSHILDPQEYFNHFRRFGDIPFITVALQNGTLLNLLVQKKILENKYAEVEVQKHLTNQMIPWIVTRLRNSGILPNQSKLKKQLVDLEKKIIELAKKKYPPWQVFITFDTESSQRECLNKFARGTLAENTTTLAFGGKQLVVKESPEPSDVIYQYSDRTQLQQFGSFFVSYAVCSALLVIAYFVVQAAYQFNRVLGTVVITVMNAGLPLAIKIITLRLEYHTRESDFQISILTKLLFARCVNSALFLFIRTDRADRFSATNLLSIQYILIADAFVTPLFRYLNLWDIFQRYSALKLYYTQSEVNAKWQGAQWTLAERYTDCLKTVYTGLFYAVPLPSGLFLVAIAMMTTYWVDKYSLFRLWRRKAAIDSSLGTISKNFFAFSVLSHVATSYYFFRFWPFCEDSSEARTSDQKEIIAIYRISLLVILIIFCLGCVYKLYRKILKMFVGYNKEIGDASDLTWRHVKGAEIFLPSISHLALAAPIIMADIDVLPTNYSPNMNHNGAGWDFTLGARGTAIKDDFEFMNALSVEQFLRSFGETRYFEAIDEELPHYSDLTASKILDASSEDENELPDYTDIEPNQNLSKTITVADFKQSRFVKKISDEWEVHKCLDNRIFYYEPATDRVLKRLPTEEGGDRLSKKMSSIIKSQSTAGFSLTKDYSQALATRRISLGGKNGSKILPPGWEIAFTADGEKYYVNHISKQTMWELPNDVDNIQLTIP